MSNALYDAGRSAFLDGGIAWSSDNIKFVMVDTGAYTVDLANDQFLSDIPSGARIATSGNVTSKTSTAGVADGTVPSIGSVTGPTVEAIVAYKDTGSAATSPLIAYWDTATGLPFTPNGGAAAISNSGGSDKFFTL